MQSYLCVTNLDPNNTCFLKKKKKITCLYNPRQHKVRILASALLRKLKIISTILQHYKQTYSRKETDRGINISVVHFISNYFYHIQDVKPGSYTKWDCVTSTERERLWWGFNTVMSKNPSSNQNIQSRFNLNSRWVVKQYKLWAVCTTQTWCKFQALWK